MLNKQYKRDSDRFFSPTERSPRHSRGSVVLDDRSDIIWEIEETKDDNVRIIHTRKCRGFKKHVPKQVKIRYNSATGRCRTLNVKGVHADFVRSVRENLKLSQLEMAELLETTDRTIRRWEAGVCNIPEDKLAKYHELKMTGVVTGSVTGVVSNACQNDDRSASEDQKTTQDAVSSSNKEVKKSIKDIKEDNVTRNDVTAKRKKKATICSLE